MSRSSDLAHRRDKPYLFAVLGLACTLAAGCAASISRNAVPANLASKVEVVGVPNVRRWGDAPLPNVRQIARLRLEQVEKHRPDFLRDKTL